MIYFEIKFGIWHYAYFSNHIRDILYSNPHTFSQHQESRKSGLIKANSIKIQIFFKKNEGI